MRQRYLENEHSTFANQIPVFVEMSRAKALGAELFILDLIAEGVASRYPRFRRWVAERMIRAGALFIMFDGLDYLDRRGYRCLEECIKSQKKELFLMHSRSKTLGQCLLEGI
jgi:hypothetical protein